MSDEKRPLPSWAEELKQRYVRGEASQFVLHGNVHDVVRQDNELLPVPEFLGRFLLAPTKDLVIRYDLSSGARFVKKAVEVPALDDLLLEKSADKVLPALERLLVTQDRVAIIIEFAEMIAPVGDPNFFGESDRQSVIALQRWSMSPQIARADNIVVLMTQNLAELNPKLVSSPQTAVVKIPMPDRNERMEIIRLINPDFEASYVERLANVTAGLRGVQVRAILQPPPESRDDAAARERYILELLQEAPHAAERAVKLARLTQGMGREELRHLLAPTAGEPKTTLDAREEVLKLIYRRKREIIERECFGLVEFVDPPHDFSVVGGIEEVKAELLAIAHNVREGRTERCPMGILFTGPMGTGKTFVAEAFVKETGLPAIKLKNFRSKWVGATEGNLEKILSVIQALGQIIVIVDEGDRAFGGSGEEDGGTSSRVMGRLKEFMSDTQNRGRVLFIVMTNRPDKLDIDLKRAGRLDRKIPFLYPQTAEEVEGVVKAQLRKNRVKSTVEFPKDRPQVSAKLVGYSNAEIEAVVLLANDYAVEAEVNTEHLEKAIADYLPSRDVEMLEYMELIAVFEASNRRMLPQKYAAMSVDDLQQRLLLLRGRVGNRR